MFTKVFKFFNGDLPCVGSLSTAKLLIDKVKSDGTFPSRQNIRESVNLSSVSLDLFRIDKSIGVAVNTDLLNKYSRKGSVSDLVLWSVKLVISWDILNLGRPSSLPHSVVFSSGSKLGRSWLMINLVFSDRRGLTSPFDIERASNPLDWGMQLFDEKFDLKRTTIMIINNKSNNG